jgi:serine/threonine protein kinase/Flp pilus assembly protein TadD
MKGNSRGGVERSAKEDGLARREIRICVACGTKFSAAGDSGLCPVCILRGAASLEPSSDGGLRSAREAERSCNNGVLPPLVGRFENYELMLDEEGRSIELGRGAMGITYKAYDVDLRLPVALKVISERYVGDELARLRFLREARAAAKVRHSNVASIFHLGKSGGEYFYAMEFVEGETLDSLIKRSGRLGAKLALEIATQVAAGLAAVHKQKLVHRDIKPTNIMVSLEEGSVGTVKIIDLGLAKAIQESQSEPAISIPGSFAGTPEFASPEQFAGVGADIRSDLYSLGVTLWVMLTGEAPFRGTPAEVMYQHQQVPLPLEKLKGVPPAAAVLLEVLLHKDPTRRFQTPAELFKAMSMITSELEARPTNKQANLRMSLARTLGSRKAKLPKAKVRERSIAVLPFDNLSDNKSDTYFADGVQDEILSNLAKVAQLRVISRTSVMRYRPGGNRDLRSIANGLRVAHVVEGTVRRHGSRVRLTSKLIDARTDEIVWSDRTDIFAIQSEIAKGIAAKLSARLSPQERKSIEEKPTNDLEAYDFYLQAKELLENITLFHMGDERQGLLSVISLLGEATRKDPKFALAYCLIVKAHYWLYTMQLERTVDARALGKVAIDEAMRLRPDLPEVHLAAAFHLYACYRDYERALVQIRIAQRSLPNNPDALALTARIACRRGRWEEATRGLQNALGLDPRNPDLLGSLATNYLWLGRYRDVEEISHRLIEIAPDKPFVKTLRVYAAFSEKGDLTSLRTLMEGLPSSTKEGSYIVSWRFELAMLARDWTSANEILSSSPNEEFYFSYADAMIPRGCLDIWLANVRGDHSKSAVGFTAAREQLKEKVETQPEDARLISALGIIDAALGRKQEAIDEAKRAVKILPISEDALDGPRFVSNLAVVYGWTNEPELAFKELTISVKTPGGVSYGELKLDPAWDPLREDPRFDKLLTELALQDGS